MRKPILEGKIDTIIEMIIEGKTFREMAKELGVNLSVLHNYISMPEHSARAREALLISADIYAEKAEQVMKDAAANLIEIARARELAHHYRWMAAKRNPRRFSEKMDVSVTQGDKLQPVIVTKIGEEIISLTSKANDKSE